MPATLQRPAGGVLSAGALEVDLDAYAGRLGGETLDLTSSEIELLAILITNKHRLLARKDLALAIGLRQARSVDVLLSSLRHKIGLEFVRNVRSRGWIIDAEKLG